MEQELLEQEINTYREKVRRCVSKEEVWQIKEDYEDALLLGISVVESNPVLSLEQKLEFVRTPEYAALPDREEGIKSEEADMQETWPVTAAEELKRKEIKRAKAMISYAGSRKGTDGQETTPFDAKG